MSKEQKKVEVVVSNYCTVIHLSMEYDGTPEDFAIEAKKLVLECMVDADADDGKQDAVVGDGWRWMWGYEVAVEDPFWGLEE